jgi:pimeloyl-ACP methyl ester carboxylesterase
MAVANPLEPALQRFLDAGAKPVVFTAGTGQMHAAAFFEEAAKLTGQCGCRAVFLTRKLDQLPRNLPDTIHAAAYAPFSQLLPQASAVVHHGGIGTVSQCLAAGVPQLIAAMSLDQPDNGERVERLGVGVTISAERFIAGHALPLLQRCLHDGGLQRAATACAERMRSRPPTDALVDWLESRRVPGRNGPTPESLRGGVPLPPVYLIPGLGADSRTFRGPWAQIPGCTFVEWPEYHGEASIAALARFVADAWRIPDGAILVAASFAGAVACEIARIRAIRTIVLVSSSTSVADYAGARRMRVLTNLVPLSRLQRFLRRRENIRRQRHAGDPRPVTQAVLDSVEMFSVCQASFYRDMYGALCRWQGFSESRTKVVRIHGRLDSQVRFPAKADLDVDGGHLIAMTHARECAEFIRAGLLNDFASLGPSEPA